MYNNVLFKLVGGYSLSHNTFLGDLKDVLPARHGIKSTFFSRNLLGGKTKGRDGDNLVAVESETNVPLVMYKLSLDKATLLRSVTSATHAFLKTGFHTYHLLSVRH
jgi:hypothetical protein